MRLTLTFLVLAALLAYINSIMAHSFFLKITFPTRFSEKNCTLIDNALCKLSHNFLNTTSGIMVTKLSDHLPYFVCVPQKTTNIQPNPKYVYVRQNNYQSVNQFKTAIENASIYDKLNTHIDADPSINYDIVNDIISNIHKDCMSQKKSNLININMPNLIG